MKDQLLFELNAFETGLISITYEHDIEGKIPFLDTIVLIEGWKLITDWYQKWTSSSRILNYNSCHSYSFKN